MPNDPPEGFAPHFRKSPVTNPWEPLFSRKIDGTVQIGLWLREAHCNSRGLLHGGVIAALADNAMGLSCGASLPSVQGLVTVSLTVDYVGAPRSANGCRSSRACSEPASRWALPMRWSRPTAPSSPAPARRFAC